MVNTLCTSGQAMVKAGVGVNLISGAAVVDEFILQAEGEVCAAARYDYITNYTNITNVGKEFLRDLTSNIAAIYLIQYDFGKYLTRITAEDQINVLRDAKLMGLSLLRDEKVRTFLKT